MSHLRSFYKNVCGAWQRLCMATVCVRNASFVYVLLYSVKCASDFSKGRHEASYLENGGINKRRVRC